MFSILVRDVYILSFFSYVSSRESEGIVYESFDTLDALIYIHTGLLSKYHDLLAKMKSFGRESESFGL